MKLSKTQQMVIDELKNGLYIWTNEGKGFKTWLGEEDGKKIKTLNVRTVTRLFELKMIRYVEEGSREGLFKYELTRK